MQQHCRCTTCKYTDYGRTCKYTEAVLCDLGQLHQTQADGSQPALFTWVELFNQRLTASITSTCAGLQQMLPHVLHAHLGDLADGLHPLSVVVHCEAVVASNQRQQRLHLIHGQPSTQAVPASSHSIIKQSQHHHKVSSCEHSWCRSCWSEHLCSALRSCSDSFHKRLATFYMLPSTACCSSGFTKT